MVVYVLKTLNIFPVIRDNIADLVPFLFAVLLSASTHSFWTYETVAVSVPNYGRNVYNLSLENKVYIICYNQICNT